MGRSARDRSPLALRPAREVEVEDFSAALAVAEYESIRAESLQSFVTSQSIIQWSMATYGVLFGAGLLAASSDVSETLQSTVEWMAVVIYGLLLPGLVCAAAWSWIGEIRRMERTGVYLRGFERRTRVETKLSASSSVVAPLNWETFLAGTANAVSPPVKGWAPYIGTSLLFGGGFGASVVFFYFWIDRIASVSGAGGGIWTLMIVDALLILAFLGVCIHTGLGVVKLGNRYYDMTKRVVRWIRPPARYGLLEVVGYIAVAAAAVALFWFFLPDVVAPWRG